MSVTDEQFQEWDKKLAENNFFGGDDPSSEDNDNYKALNGAEPPSQYLNLWGWFLVVNLFTEDVRSTWQAPKAGKKGGKKGKKEDKKEDKKEEEDDFDAMFGEDEDDAEAKASAAAKAEKAKKDAKKKGPIEKSIILFEVKPWEAGQDLDSLATKIFAEIEQDGLLWKTEFRTEPIGYGIYKLIVGCTIEDEKVSVDDLQEKIAETFSDEVQSVDILSFNKV